MKGGSSKPKKHRVKPKDYANDETGSDDADTEADSKPVAATTARSGDGAKKGAAPAKSSTKAKVSSKAKP